MYDLLTPIVESPRMLDYYHTLKTKVESEFELRKRFYEEMTEQEKTEFINGEIVVHSPVMLRHNSCGLMLLNLLSVYVRVHKLGLVGYEKLLICLTRNDYEPDICFFSNAKADKFNKKTMFFPPPDFIVEILSPSTEKTDRGVKFIDYAAHHIQEYWIIDPDNESIEQYILDNDHYILKQKVADGTIESEVISGFSIPVRAIFDETINWNTLKLIKE